MNKLLKEYIKNSIKTIKSINENKISIKPQITKIKNMCETENIEKIFSNLNIKNSDLLDYKFLLYIGEEDSDYSLQLTSSIKFTYLNNDKNVKEDYYYRIADVLFDLLPDSKKVNDQNQVERRIYKIYHTRYVKENLGALMYDAIIEYVSLKKGVLISDRELVSSEAIPLWEKYLERDDIKKAQLDIDLNHHSEYEDTIYQQTPYYIKDDLEQNISIEYADEVFGNYEYWFDTPFAKGLYKNDHDCIVLKSLLEDERFIVTLSGVNT